MQHMRHLTLPISLIAALRLAAQGEVYTVRPLDIKPAGIDFAPVIVDSSLVFCSLRERDQIVGYTSEETGNPLCDMYRMRIRSGVPGKPFPYGEAINTEVNDGPAAFMDNGRTMCFTRNLKRAKDLSGDEGDENLGLFFSSRKDGGWSKARPFDHNDPGYNVMHATFSADGTRLLFASDMPGGQGGTDLYMCEMEAGDWGLPMNLGPAINSGNNELFPFLEEDGALFFVTDREGGSGGLDIWSCKPDDNAWQAPSALPTPINSSGNDLGFTCYPGGLSGYFSSNRDGDDRIYRFDRSIPLFRDCTPQEDNNYCYVFREEGSMRIGKQPLRYQWDLGDGTKVDDLKARHCYKGPGKYSVTLNIIDTVTNDVYFREAHYDLVIDDVHQPYITIGDTARTGREVHFDARQTYLPEMRIADWKWDFGDGIMGEGQAVLHSFDQPGSYTVRLDVLSRPDNSGSVSNRCITRNITVIDRFKDMADAPVNVEYMAANGESREFAFQELPTDAFDLTVREGQDVRFSVELFRSRERLDLDDPRFTEIRKFYPVIERYDPATSTYTYSVGEAKDLGELYEVFNKVKELKYMDAMVMAVEMEKVLDMSQLAGMDAEDLNNSVLRVSTVLFATGKHTFDPIFEEQLASVLKLVRKHSQLKLVIEAHTDDVGKDDFNLNLSQRRAQSITDWFLARGIDADRLVAVGHGENKPLASNSDEMHRSLNRRVEFRLALDSAAQAMGK